METTKDTTTFTVNTTTARLLAMLRDELSATPPEPNTDMHFGHQLESVAVTYYEWQRKVDALRLLIGIRLTNEALDAGIHKDSLDSPAEADNA